MLLHFNGFEECILGTFVIPAPLDADHVSFFSLSLCDRFGPPMGPQRDHLGTLFDILVGPIGTYVKFRL